MAHWAKLSNLDNLLHAPCIVNGKEKEMSGKTSRMIRKGINSLKKDRQSISNELVLELMNSPLRYRLAFALRIVFPRRRKNG